MDQALEVVDEYQKKILKLEHDVLIQPNMKTVRYCKQNNTCPTFTPNQYYNCSLFAVHVLSGDLTLHKRTLEPIKSLIYGLRRYDVDRCAALLAGGPQSVDPKTVTGYMTHKAKIYLVCLFSLCFDGEAATNVTHATGRRA